jgi:hypothetical protein
LKVEVAHYSIGVTNVQAVVTKIDGCKDLLCSPNIMFAKIKGGVLTISISEFSDSICIDDQNELIINWP